MALQGFIGIPKDPRSTAAIEFWDQCKSDPERSWMEREWEEIARLIRPQRGGFGMDDHRNRSRERPLNSEPILASASMAAGVYSAITNPANRWGGLETPDADFNTWRPMAEWNDLITRAVHNSLGSSVSNFYSSTFQGYADIAAFGNFAAYDEIDMGERRFIDVTLSLSEVVVDIDAHGRVVQAGRKFRLKPKAAMLMFGKDALPEKLTKMAEDGKTDDVVFYHHVLYNYDFERGRLGSRGKRWLSHYACEIEETLVRVSGYQEMPFYFPRWDVDSGMTYGTGPGFIALPSARTVNLMDAATVRAAQYAADPTRLVPDRNAVPLNGRFKPGSVVYGGVDMRGTKLVQQDNATGNIGLTEEEKRQKIEAVKEVFNYSVMGLHGRTGMTREETQIIEQARLRNWAPHADRIMEEYGARKLERRFSMLWRAGQLPPPPKEAEGLPLRVKYQSMATMAMKAREAAEVRDYIADLGALAQLSPRAAQRFDDRIDHDAYAEVLHDARPSMPAKILDSRENADARAAERAQQEQQARQMQMLQAGAGAAKDAGAAIQSLMPQGGQA